MYSAEYSDSAKITSRHTPSRDQLNIFRKVEKITKSFIKVSIADLKYLNFYKD